MQQKKYRSTLYDPKAIVFLEGQLIGGFCLEVVQANHPVSHLMYRTERVAPWEMEIIIPKQNESDTIK